MQGRRLQDGFVLPEQEISVDNLAPGMYIVRLSVDGAEGKPQKIIKL